LWKCRIMKSTFKYNVSSTPSHISLSSLHIPRRMFYGYYGCKVLRSSCLSVCLSVCLFVSLSVHSHISKTINLNLKRFSVHVTCDRGSVPWRQYNMFSTSGFVDDVMFSHNRAYGPESNTMGIFRHVRQGQNQGQSCRLWWHVCYHKISNIYGWWQFSTKFLSVDRNLTWCK